MDNLTHSLAGALIGEAAHDLSKSDSQKQRSLLITASILANNFPDLDSLYARIMPPPLGYLLHHRGHTHTLLGLIPQAFLIFGLLFLSRTFREELRHARVRLLTIFIIAIGLCTHLLLDSWNSYGLHPFYPFSRDWIYGDLIFIVEPFIWMAFACPLFFTLKNRWIKSALAGIICVVPMLAAYRGFVMWYSVFASFSFGLIVLFFAQRVHRVFAKALIGVIAAAVFLATQAYSASQVRAQMRAAFIPKSSTHKILDLVLNPLPANPFCWSVIEIESDPSRDKYITFGKTYSAFPSVVSPESCLAFRSPAPYNETALSSIANLVANDCYVDAWLRFARAPFFDQDFVFDLRFNQRESNFSSLRISHEKRECPRFIPPWSKPREDLFE